MDTLRFGFFDEPVGPIDPASFELRSPMGHMLSADEARDEFRQFQFLGAVSDDIVVGCAITSSKVLSSGFAYMCRMSDQQLVQLRLRASADGDLVMSSDPDHGTSTLTSPKGTMAMIADGSTKRLIVESESLNIDIELDEAGFDTQRICTQTGPTGFAYAQKVAGVPATGTATSELGDVEMTDVGACGHHDFTAGFLRPETWWNWACLSATTADGQHIGLNLSCGTNETSYTENCLWIDGQIHRVSGAVFDFDPDDWNARWNIATVDGSVELRFEPAHGYHATGESGPVATNFHQLFGTFSGSLQTGDGSRLAITSLPGFAETQYLRW